MGLRIELKPFERLVVGESLITNGDTRISFMIEGNEPILREKDVLLPEKADTPAAQVYVCVQMMYLERDLAKFQSLYFEAVRQLLAVMPGFCEKIERVSHLVLEECYYKALSELKKLLLEEREMLTHV